MIASFCSFSLFKKLFFLCTIVLAADAITLQCDYRIEQHFGYDNVYVCKTRNVNIREPSAVTSLTGGHKLGKSRSDVQFLHIVDQPCHYLPSGIEKFFPSIKFLKLQGTGLKIISSVDLQPLTNLVKLELPSNALEILDSDLFAFSKNLDHVHFGSNKIKHVGVGILHNFNNKQANLFFNDNPCINVSGTVDEVQHTLETMCQPIKAAEYLKIIVSCAALESGIASNTV